MPSHRNSNYVVITPAKDEERHIGATIDSMLDQTILPSLWVIVDDGSTDATPQIIDEVVKRIPWIRLAQTNRRTSRFPGADVVNAFLFGLSQVHVDYDYIVKLDADLEFRDEYFEKLLDAFKLDPRLGIAGGVCAHRVRNSAVIDETPEYHVRGATKMYRKECYQQIGGLVPAMGWDGIDEMKALSLGWRTRSIPELVIIHSRITGSATGLLRYAWRWGKSMHFMGYHPLFALASCSKRIWKQPFLLFGISMLAGYVYSAASNDPLLEDRDLRIFIRDFQRRRITSGIGLSQSR